MNLMMMNQKMTGLMNKMANYRVLDYKKGFRKDNGNMVYGLTAMFYYTIGFIKYHIKKRGEK